MSFPEKSSIATIAVLVAVYGGYALVVGARFAGGDVGSVAYKALMVLALVPLVALMAISHGVLAAIDPKDADAFDERDRQIGTRAGSVGGSVLAVGVFGAIVLALFEVAYFYIANALLLAWVLAEIVGHVATLVLYRRGI